MPVTVHDIARELNLSAMTVSRALNHQEGKSVSPVTRERVEQAALAMGYQLNRNARALATGRSHVIGIWISHLRSSVYSRLATACRQEIEAAGLAVSICEMDWHFPSPASSRRFQWPLDGILAIDPPESPVLTQLLGATPWQEIPRVHLGSGQTVRWAGDFAHVDLGAGTQAAIEHLLRVGCQRIAYVVPGGLAQPGMGYYDVYARAMRAAGQRFECILCNDWSCAAVRRTVRDYIQQQGPPDGIFCHYDEFTMAAFRALRDLDLRIPDEVALIGCEGNEFLEYFDPPLSTVALPIDELAQRAWQLLQRRINEPAAPPQGIALPFEFIARASSR